ncbi:50S ribosomal protein L13 [Patescibacteria group bacterium]|nr:50S ribosomal protein L13 [Patescibacteria group bacterium]
MTLFNHNIKPNQITRSWYLVDASDKVLGRIATRIADILRGKHQPYFSPQWDMGDYVIVTNAVKVKLTSNKDDTKIYYRHTGYPGGIRSETAGELRARKPEELIIRAVRRMLPKNRLSRQIIKKLFVYAGETHPHGKRKFEKLNL